MVDDLRLRDEPSMTADVVDALNAGESVAAVDGQPVVADGLTWYEVRQGPGPRDGWVTSGPDRTWLSVVGNGRIAFYCTTCVPAPGGGGGGATFTIEPDGSDQRMLLDQSATPTWSPDGTRMAIVLHDQVPPRIALMDVDGRDMGDIGFGTEPAWSADGSQLAYVDADGRLVVVDEQGSPSVLADQGTTPAWAPDGSRLAYVAVHCPGCAPQEVDAPIAGFVVDLTDQTTELLVETAHDPRWSPDGESIAVSRLTYANDIAWEFAQVPSGGGDPAQVPGVPDQAAVGGFAWSPDGSRMAFGDADGIVVASADGSDRQLVAAHEEFEFAHNPRWSPDGRFILYDMGATQGDAIYPWVVGRDGSDPHRLGERSGYDADWQALLTPLP
jgi:dipeptidyl aminopeptidase/acylaminoacyl peptidase